MSNEELIARQAKEIYELRDKLEQAESSSNMWFKEAQKLRENAMQTTYNSENCMNPAKRNEHE